MTLPHPGKFSAFCARARGFWRRDEGATAVEFALLVIPFIFLLLMIVDVALMYLVGGSLTNATQVVARQIRVGTITSSNTSYSTLKSKICAQTMFAVNCTSKIYVSIREITDSSTISSGSPLDSNGNFPTAQTYYTGIGSSTILMLVYLPWKPFFIPLGTGQMSDGSYLIAAGSFFQNEPF